MLGRRGGRGDWTLSGIPVRGRGRGRARARGFGRGRGPPNRPMTGPIVKLKLTHKAKSIPVEAPANATFGQLKALASQETGIPPEGMSFLFRGRKKADNEVLALAGVRNGAEVKIMETEGYRQQRTAEQPEEPEFLAFSEEDAAAARAAAAKEAALQKSQVSARDQALAAIQGIRQQVDGLEQQAREVMQQPQQDGATGSSRMAAGLIEALTQKLLALDNVTVESDQELRQKRKAEINRINQLCDSLESHRKRQA